MKIIVIDGKKRHQPFPLQAAAPLAIIGMLHIERRTLIDQHQNIVKPFDGNT